MNNNDNFLSKKAWDLFGQDQCFLCGKCLAEHLEGTGKKFDMYCRTGYFYPMEAC